MTSPLLVAPILLSVTLLVSGLAKLGARRGTVDAMTSLRLPLRAEWLCSTPGSWYAKVFRSRITHSHHRTRLRRD